MESLKKISKNFDTTKKEVGFIKIYEDYLKDFRFKKNKILEVGFTKHSLGMFRKYFPNSHIVGLDIREEKVKLKNVQTYVGSQTDPKVLDKIIRAYKNFDIIIDDGSHIDSHIMTTFHTLFEKYLSPGGLYFVEDYLNTLTYVSDGIHSIDYKNELTTIIKK